MQLEDYFEFDKSDSDYGPIERIRIKGHRIGIEHIIGFHQQGNSPEEIVKTHYPSLSLEEVYATITYYLHNRDRVEKYIQHGEQIADAIYQEVVRTRKPGGVGDKVRALRAAAIEQQKRESA